MFCSESIKDLKFAHFIIYYKVILFKVLYVITYYNRMSPTKLDHYFYKMKFDTDGTL